MKNDEKMARRKKLMVWFLIIIMVASAFGAVFFGFNTGQTRKYNDFSFKETDRGWLTNIHGQKYFFNYLPSDTEDINISVEIAALLNGKMEIDTTYNLNDTLNQTIALAQFQIARYLQQGNIFLRNGITTNSTYNVPIIACDKSTSSVPVIFFAKGNETSIKQGSCILAQAPNDFEMLRLADRLTYQILGVMV